MTPERGWFDDGPAFLCASGAIPRAACPRAPSCYSYGRYGPYERTLALSPFPCVPCALARVFPSSVPYEGVRRF